MTKAFHRLRGWLRARGSGAVRRTPTVLQMEAVECGAAALAIVLAHYGRWTPLEELRTACGVTRDGSKASNVVKAARRFGLHAKGLKVEPGSLRKVSLPAILHWNFNHFVVLEGFREDLAYLNDPAYGPRKVSLRELDESFTGVVLTFEPGPGFRPEGTPPRFLPAVKERLLGSGAAVLFVVLAGLLLAVPTLLIPTFTKLFVDRVLLESRWEWLSPLLFAMAVAAVLAGALTWLQQSYLLRLETRLAIAGSGRFLHHVLSLPQEFFHQRFAGDISSRVSINDRVAQLLSRDLAASLLGVMTALTLLVLLLSFDPLLTLVGVGIAACNVLALQQVSRLRADGNRRLLQERGKLSGAAVGGLRMIETLKATGGELAFFARWAGYQAKVVNARQELELYTQMLDVVPPLLAALNTAVILGLGSLKVIDGALTLGGLIAFQALMAAFLAPVQRLVSLGATLQTVGGDLARLDDVLRHPADPLLLHRTGPTRSEEGPDLELTKLTGHLELRGITFGYSPLSPPLLESFSLTVRPGRRVALVGGSGSGKSTVTKLIMGLYQPWSGEILFDGRPLSAHSSRVFTASVGYVDQSSYLFAGSIRDNLTLWDPTAALPELVAAARDAELHDDIGSRPGGYESAVEEGGANFSGGQRQRLELARALVERPTLLILDEATSALDPVTEQHIDENLRRRGCACLIVAHRLSTIRDADEIVVLEQGKVVERGRHDDLKARSGTYARLIEAQ